MPNSEPFKYVLLLCAFTFLMTFDATAQQAEQASSANEFRVALSTEVGSIDNFLHDSDEQLSTAFVVFSPSLYLKTQHQRQLLTLSLDSKHFTYQDFSTDDHSDFDLKANHQYKFANNKSWFFNGNIQEKYQLRGTGLSLGEANTLNKGDEKQTYSLSTGYFYGSDASVAKLTAELGLLAERFNTRRDQTRILDQKDQFFQLGFDYLMTGQSYFSTDFIYNNISAEYNPSQDKQKFTGLLGFKWRSSVMTQVEVLLGYKEVKFKESTFNDQGNFSWRAKIDWSPVASTKIAFSTGRVIEEANRLSNSFRLVDRYQLNFVTDFNAMLQSTATLRYQDDTVFFENTDDNETYVTADIMLKYQRNHWLSMFVKYSFSDFNDDPERISYQRNEISIGFNVTI